MVQFFGQILQAVFGQLHGLQGAIQLLLDGGVPLLLPLESLLYFILEPVLAARTREVLASH